MNELINIQNKDGQLTVSSREVASNFEKQNKHVMEAIRELETSVEKSTHLFIPSTYKDSYGRDQNEYQLTRDGFSLLVMGFTGTKALEWKLKYIEAFNKMENEIRTSFSELSPQLQLLIGIERKQREHDKAIADTNTRIDGIKEIVSLDTNSWRQDAKNLISKIAMAMGGFEYMKDAQAEIYKTLDTRFGVSLETRLTNKRRRMADEGVCKSTRDKLTRVDIIAEDKKLIEGYIIIIKEMAIKYGVADVNEDKRCSM